MPTFYFHICEPDGSLAKDDECMNLPDLESARKEAAASIRDLCVEAAKGSEVSARSIQIADDAGVVLAVIPFRNTANKR
jgi:hypothetical protein